MLDLNVSASVFVPKSLTEVKGNTLTLLEPDFYTYAEFSTFENIYIEFQRNGLIGAKNERGLSVLFRTWYENKQLSYP